MTASAARPTASDIAAMIKTAGDLTDGLSEAAVEKILSKGRMQTYPKGAMILEREFQKAKLFIALKGTTKLVATTEDGREFVSSFMGPGRIWGIHACLADRRETYDIMAETDCTVLELESRTLQDLMWEDRELQEAMIEILCKRLSLALSVVEQFATWSPRQRLAWRILQIVHGTLGVGTVITRHSIAISQDAIAAMIGLSRQRTNKLLKEFERDGYVEIEYGSIKVKDPSGLEIVVRDVSRG